MQEQSENSIRLEILAEISRIAEMQNKKLALLTDELPLMESGLDSLCIAVLVASLDEKLQLDPFASDESLEFPVSLGDFIRLYENAAA